MPMRSDSKQYINLSNRDHEPDSPAPWYWRLIALTASWMILGGYLILPGLYAKDPQLKFSPAVLSVFVVALLTAGYSFTTLLCFACRNEMFQAEAVFLPALTSSAIGLLTIAYNFLSSRSYVWGTAAISGTVISTTATVLYTILLLWTHRRIIKRQEAKTSRSAHLYSEPSFYTNYIQNMYPSTSRSPSAQPQETPLTEDDRINHQMAMLLMKSDSGPSPDASSATFRIHLPEDREERDRQLHSAELVGTPPQSYSDMNRNCGDSLTEARAWERSDRGRTQNRPSSVGGHSTHSRGLSREERRREIEMGHV